MANNHVTVGLYPNGQFKVNIVRPEHLEGHTQYNLTMRPGRAFFVNGECIHDGFMGSEMIESFKEKLQTMEFNTAIASEEYV